MSIGFKFPFTQNTGSIGHFDMTNEQIDAVSQNIRSLLLTNSGDRVMHYNMATDLRSMLFEPQDNELKEKIVDRITSQMSLWLPFIELDVLNILFSVDTPNIPENAIGIYIKFFMIDNPELSNVVTVIIS